MTYPDNRLRLRLFIGGALADEVWISADDPDAAAKTDAASVRHVALCAAADDRGVPWLTEVYDPDAPPDHAYVRIGTDPAGMADPVPLGADLLGRILDTHGGPR